MLRKMLLSCAAVGVSLVLVVGCDNQPAKPTTPAKPDAAKTEVKPDATKEAKPDAKKDDGKINSSKPLPKRGAHTTQSK